MLELYPPLIMGGDCLWNRKEDNIGDLNPLVSGDMHKDKFNKGLSMAEQSLLNLSLRRSPGTEGIRSPILGSSLLLQRQSCPIMKGGENQLGSLSSVLFLGVPEAVSSNAKRRISSTRS